LKAEVMNGSDFRRWRTSYGLSQQELGDEMGVTRTTIQNWEAQVGELSTIAANGAKIWDRRLRQEESLRGPVTLIYADGPMMLSSQGPQRVAMKNPICRTRRFSVASRCSRVIPGSSIPSCWSESGMISGT
jgi:DNA-binding XRE family transcriptional regulator